MLSGGVQDNQACLSPTQLACPHLAAALPLRQQIVELHLSACLRCQLTLPCMLTRPALQFMLLTENPEKIPDNEHCSAGAADQPACAPGFFDAAPVRGAEPQRPHTCCEGFFCPAELTCMIPCPIGAYCPRWVAPEPGRLATIVCCCAYWLRATHPLPAAAKLADVCCPMLPAAAGPGLHRPLMLTRHMAMHSGVLHTPTRSDLIWVAVAPTRSACTECTTLHLVLQ